MVVAVPIVAVAALLVLFLFILALVVVFAAGGLAYQATKGSISFSQGLPWPLSELAVPLGYALGLIVTTMRSVEGNLVWAFYRGAQAFSQLFTLTLGPILAGFKGWIDDLYNRTNFMLGVEIPALAAQVAGLAAAAGGSVAALAQLLTVTIPQMQAAQAAETAARAQLAGQVAQITGSTVPAVLSRLSGLETASAIDAKLIAALNVYLPILGGLQEWESADAAGLAGLAGQLQRQAGRIGALENKLTGATSLAILAALSVALAQQLVRVAEDPCYCLTTGGFSDLPGRVEMLELG